jgi:hypothetical protein
VAALLATAVAVYRATHRQAPPVRTVTRASLVLPAGHTLTGFSRSYPLAVSSDGRRIAYVSRAAEGTRLSVQGLDEREPRVVPRTAGARFPFFSPNGEWVGFWADGWLQKVPFAGGRPIRIAEARALDYGLETTGSG